MRPIRTVASNFTMLGFRPEIADLPGRIDQEDGRYTGVFELDDDERQAIADGGQIKLTIWSLPIPPVSLEACLLAEVYEDRQGEPDYRCSDCRALYVGKRADELERKCGQCGGELQKAGGP